MGRITTLTSLVKHEYPRLPAKKITRKMVDEVIAGFRKKGGLLAKDFRAYAPYKPASPKVNGIRMRWEKGKLVPRHGSANRG